MVVWVAATACSAEPVCSKLSDEEKEKLWVLTGHRDESGEKRSGIKVAALTPALCEKYAIREVVLQWDEDYDFNWVTNEQKLRAFFSNRGVPVLSVKESTDWLDQKIAGTADGTALVMGNGIVPTNWLTKPWEASRLVRYLRAGGRIVWAGDVLFCNGQGARGGLVGVGGTFDKTAFRLDGFLGMRIDRATMYGKYDKSIKQTDKAKAWGLERSYGLVRPVLNDGILDPFVCASDGSFADGGQVCLKVENPLSGIVLLSGALNAADESLLRDIWRCAWWSGKSVTIPTPSAAALAAANPPELTFGEKNLRSVFLRGEQVKVGVRLNGAKGGKATLKLIDAKGATLREWTGTISTSENGHSCPFAHGTEEPFFSSGTDKSVRSPLDFSFFDLRGLRRDVYTAELTLNGQTSRRELRVAPPVDKNGLSISMWANFSKPVSRMRRQFEDDILSYDIEPMPNDTSLAAAYDWSLWSGVPFVARRMPNTLQAWAPEGYDNFMRLLDGSIRPVRAEGNRPTSRGYDNPFRRQMQADVFREMGRFDAAFPAYRGVTFTADDYSQWFGPSWNRFAVEGFANRYGRELTREPNKIAEGVVRDDDPAVLAARWFAGTHADAAKRSSEALAEATGGFGKAAPIPGGMILPMNMWSAMNPSVGFGRNGWSQASFYYYNAYWQPFVANTFWTIAARMGDRRRTVWVMPDCYVSGFESYYEQNFWHLLAGGAQGLGYFMLGQRQEASKKTLRHAGCLAKDFGVYLNALEPVRAKAVQVIPFENMIAVPERWHQSVVIWGNLALNGIDTDPVAADEDWEDARAAFLFNVRTLTDSSLAHLKRFQRRGGRVYIDAASAKAIPHDDMTVVSADVARFDNKDFDTPRVDKAVAALGGPELRPIVSQTRGVFTRRYTDRLGNRVCWFVDTVGGDLWRQFNASTRNHKKGDPALEGKGGYGTSFEATVQINESVAPVVWDIFARKQISKLDHHSSPSNFAFSLPRWGAKLVAFLPESPAPFEITAPADVCPGVAFELAVETSGKCAVPFSVSAVDPERKVSQEYKGRLLSDATGRVALPFAFAVNDRRGDWTFRVTNEFTGETKTVTVCLK